MPHNLYKKYQIIIKIVEMFNKRQNDDMDDFKKKREQHSLSIRRINREQILNKRRNIVEHHKQQSSSTSVLDSNLNDTIVDKRFETELKKFNQEVYNGELFDHYAAMVESTDIVTRHHGLVAIRNLVDSDSNEMITKFMERKLLPTMIGLVKQSDYPQMKLEGIWIIANITYGEHVCQVLVQQGVIDISLTLVRQNMTSFVDHALVALGNIAADHVRFRDLILRGGGLQIVYQCLASVKKQSTFQNCIWLITNLCRGTPPPTYTLIDTAIPVLCQSLKSKVFQNPNSHKVVSDVLWTLAGFCEGSKAKADRIAHQGVIPIIINYATQSVNLLYFPAVQIVGNFAGLGEIQTQALIKNGVFELCYRLLSHHKKQIRREACWILSNLAAGVKSQIQVFLSHKQILDKLIELFNSQQLDVKSEICWIYPNLGHLGNKHQIVKLYIHYDIMQIYVNLLSETDTDVLVSTLQSLQKVLLVGNRALVNGSNVMLMKFMEYGGVDKLATLQMNTSTAVYDCAVSILSKFFDLE